MLNYEKLKFQELDSLPWRTYPGSKLKFLPEGIVLRYETEDGRVKYNLLGNWPSGNECAIPDDKDDFSFMYASIMDDYEMSDADPGYINNELLGLIKFTGWAWVNETLRENKVCQN